MIMRVLLLLSLSWIIGLTRPLFSIANLEVSGRALILIGGGLFLLVKSTREIHHKLEEDDQMMSGAVHASFSSVLVQIVLLDIVFSLDSVITAIGMTSNISIAVVAVVISVGIMLFAAKPLSDFVNRHPTIKILALSFLLLLGMTLVADGSGQHIPKGYIYFAMAFSVFVEFLNMRLRAESEPVHLSQRLLNEDVVAGVSQDR
jgi:predicted tellurium resistance membrane protein TerC